MNHHRSLPFLFSFSVLLFAILVVAGCGKRYPGKERLYPVSITVTDNGAPFTRATVILVREGGPTIINAGGVTDTNGVAQIKTDAQWPGVPVGTYKVMLNKDVAPPRDLSDEEYQKLDFEAKEAYDKKMHAKWMSMPQLVPKILRGPQSPLEIEVTSSSDNTASFDIGKY